MNMRTPSAVCMGIVMMILGPGCSIREDRSECPCRVTIDLSGFDRDRFSFLGVTAVSADGFCYDRLLYGNGIPEILTLNVPKGVIWLNMMTEEDNMYPYGFLPYGASHDGRPQCACTVGDSGYYIIGKGEGCPPVYRHTVIAGMSGDVYPVVADLKKNFCRITVRLISGTEQEFGLEFRGNVCGYRISGSPLEGDFIYRSDIVSGGSCTLSVPRQSDGSLTMVVSDDDGEPREFPLGEYIIAGGYDWSAESLDDIEVVLDYVKTEIVFKVRDWEKIFQFDIVI